MAFDTQGSGYLQSASGPEGGTLMGAGGLFQSFSFGCWIFPRALPFPIYHNTNDFYAPEAVLVDANGKITFLFCGGGNSHQYQSSTLTVQTNRWQFVGVANYFTGTTFQLDGATESISGEYNLAGGVNYVVTLGKDTWPGWVGGSGVGDGMYADPCWFGQQLDANARTHLYAAKKGAALELETAWDIRGYMPLDDDLADRSDQARCLISQVRLARTGGAWVPDPPHITPAPLRYDWTLPVPPTPRFNPRAPWTWRSVRDRLATGGGPLLAPLAAYYRRMRA